MKENFAQNNNMELENESLQLTRICITTTFPVGEKSIFFQKPLQGRFPTRLFLYCTQMSIAKLQKNPVYCHSHPGLAVRHMCQWESRIFAFFVNFPCYSMGILHFLNFPCYSMEFEAQKLQLGGGTDGWTYGRTSGNSPLCPTGHWPFGAAAQKGKK